MTALEVGARRRVAWSDLGLAAGLLVLAVMGTAPAVQNQGEPPPGPLAYVLAVVAAVSVAWWRARPMATFAVVSVATTIFFAIYHYGPIWTSLVFAIAGFAFASPLRRTVGSVGALVVVFVAVLTVGVVTDDRVWAEIAPAAAWAVVPAAVGVVVRVRREARAGVREEQARRAASEERLQMARELHDIVGHGLAVIAMQAGVALHVLERDAERLPTAAKLRQALEAIRQTSRESLDGLRAELEVLRSATPRTPNAGVADIVPLVDRIRSGGVPVELRIDVDSLPAELDAAVYRIVQESLTNVLRHAGPDASATVDITGPGDGVGDALRIEVVDTGRGGGRQSEDGHGIVGMRHRVEQLGGELRAGPESGGGFAVRARLPLAAQLSDLGDATGDTGRTGEE